MLREIDWFVELTDEQIQQFQRIDYSDGDLKRIGSEWWELIRSIPQGHRAVFIPSVSAWTLLLDPVTAYFAADMIGTE